ncbi:Ubiquinone biosynthesis O-methyltransferase [Smittium culicis]|uniref:Ubiquinone biosynthesis O-methyltransferase n=1 Tax=Smittium culicis TaxID=133412 RepID=A0A1R1Y210_9FUNG|nr:Ubiquinone biosynthesis O-methyltransferase [Smittium culicis]
MKGAETGRPLEGAKVLDIGCGGGLSSESLSRLGGDVLGIDASYENIGVAKVHSKEDFEFVEGLSVIPKGTHTYEKFLKPKELISIMEDNSNGMKVVDNSGIWYNPLNNSWKVVDRDIMGVVNSGVQSNYLLTAVKL